MREDSYERSDELVNPLAEPSKRVNTCHENRSCTGFKNTRPRAAPDATGPTHSQVLALVTAVVAAGGIGFREDELRDAGAGLDLDVVVDRKQALASPLVTRVPDGGVEGTGVPQQRRPRIDEADVVGRHRDGLGVPDHVPAGREVVDPPLLGVRGPAGDGVGGPADPVADLLAVAADTSRFPLVVDRLQPQVDPVGLDLFVGRRRDLFGDEGTAPVHTRGSAAPVKSLALGRPAFDRLLRTGAQHVAMDAETFDEQKYVDLFPKLQQAYKNAFNRVNERYDSTLVHGIDQQVLDESEPFYDESDGFYLELPEDPYGRLTGVVVEEERFEAVLEEYVGEIERELERVFDA